MMIFNVDARWNNYNNRHFGISDPEIFIKKVPIDGNDQFVVVSNCNHVITGGENALENKIFGEWY
jgi:hypothetical protein